MKHAGIYSDIRAELLSFKLWEQEQLCNWKEKPTGKPAPNLLVFPSVLVSVQRSKMFVILKKQPHNFFILVRCAPSCCLQVKF